ncbi:MAG: hypothetical protein KME52_07105 [Desmonostoc geniculatum HA4340-LM1]|nr:hypothetical protein [Desmonostoc geniculatum HA4340-LM1]
MQQLQRFQVLRSLGFVFWLSLPVIGLVFWLGSGFIGDRILSHSRVTKKYLLADTQSARQMMKRVVAIEVQMIPQQGISRVKVKTSNSVLKTIVFEFPVTDMSQLQATLSQELGLPRDRVKELVVEVGE